MARSQSELKEVLETIVDAEENDIAVYIQPPSTLKYPCIKIDNDRPSHYSYADNVKYLLRKGYTITIMTRDPNSPIPGQVEALPHCGFDRRFVTDGLYHFVYQLFF
jgi:hypothetical protein